MNVFEEYLSQITDKHQRERMNELLEWVHKRFPQLQPRVAWNQPMFTDHGTFIIGFSISKPHIALSPERFTLERFGAAIDKAGYHRSKQLFRITWDDPIDFALLADIIQFNIDTKSDYTSFWRK